jgi:threonyl-tRNA synthetase
MQEDVKESDHRKIGKELDLFVFSDLVGAGLPLWTPRGTILRQQLDDFVQEMRDEHGYRAVTIPHITKKDLYEKSGHWTKFKEDLFHVNSREGHEFAMKPMNCPHHTQIYASRPRSYKELPIRYRETTMNYRDEQTGELNGLLRARSFTQDDAHVFCREEHILEEVLKIWDIVEKFYKAFGFELTLRFSKRDPTTPDAYAGTNEMWDLAEAELNKAITQRKPGSVEEGVGEAAFYGPKLDFTATDSLGRKWQVATIQIDFSQPEGLGLTYINEEGQEARPVMIHCAIMGSIERFLAVLIEHTGGKFPVWLAPEQLRLATLNQEENIVNAAKDLAAKAAALGVRVEIDDSNESVGKKIRNAEEMKVPYMVVIGNKELQDNKLIPRVRSDLGDEPKESLAFDDFLAKVAAEANGRLASTTL